MSKIIIYVLIPISILIMVLFGFIIHDLFHLGRKDQINTENISILSDNSNTMIDDMSIVNNNDDMKKGVKKK